METFQTLLLAAVLVLCLVILAKISKILNELRTPVVKKLNPEFNKQGRRVNLQDNRPQNRDNRPQQNQQRPGTPGAGPRPQGGAPEQNRENRDNRDNRDNRGDRDRNRDGRGDRDRNRDGRGDRDRNRDGRRDNRGDRDRNRRPSEIFGNESAESATQPSVEGTSAPVEAPVQRSPYDSRPNLEGRRPLETRNTEPAVVESSYQAPAASEASTSDAPEFDPSRMRHGRRTVVRKVAGLEPEAAPATPETPANG